jgi:hypothetical protein
MDISALPKTLQRRPEIRALSLRVYEVGLNRFQVPGTNRIHDVWIDFITKTLTCTCQASPRCAHIHAVRNHQKQKEQSCH